MVIGGHGNLMVPLPTGIPLPDLLPEDKISRLVERTVNGGHLELLKQGSAFYAPSSAIVSMAEAVIKDSKSVPPGLCLS